MILFFHTPEFFPPLDFWFGLLNSDAWVVLDHVRFTTRSRQSRCRIKCDSSIQQLAVAVKRPCNKAICNMVIDNFHPWRRYFIRAIEKGYSDTPYFNGYFEGLKYYIEAPNVLLETLTLQTTLWVAELMGRHVRLFCTKDYYKNYPASKVIPILLDKLGGEPFHERFNHPYYQQRAEPFEKDLSILDALFCCGAEDVRKLLSGNYL